MQHSDSILATYGQSEKMISEEALDLYGSKDFSEQLSKGDKSYLGNKAFRTHSIESTKAKIFVEFVALVIRNRFHQCVRKQRIGNGNKRNYLTVPAAIRRLEKIEMVSLRGQGYHLAYALTATQKEILKAFGMTAANVRSQAATVSDALVGSESAGA